MPTPGILGPRVGVVAALAVPRFAASPITFEDASTHQDREQTEHGEGETLAAGPGQLSVGSCAGRRPFNYLQQRLRDASPEALGSSVDSDYTVRPCP